MKKISSTLAVFFSITFCFCQDTRTAQSMNKASWEEELTETVKQEMGIQYPIFKVFEYEDLKGRALIVLTESNESVNTKGEPVNSALAAFLLRGSNGNFEKEWENTHDIKKDKQNEKSIWYWSKYFECSDADKDTESETFLIFGTLGENGFDDGRVFIEIYYEGQLISIEHQNSITDLHRITLINSAFYALPKAVQDKVIYKMKLMINAKQAIFSANWEQNMANKITEIRER